MTIHKIQGGTIKLGDSITSSFKDIFGGSQAYTVLSRAKQLDQLYLLDDLYEDKIYTTRKPLVALKELEERAINNNYIGKRDDQVNIIVLNVQNLTHHIEDIKRHHILHDQNLKVFCETWITAIHRNEIDQRYSLNNYAPNFCNVGNGKGLVGYSDSSFRYEESVIQETHQIIKYSTSFLDKSNQKL